MRLEKKYKKLIKLNTTVPLLPLKRVLDFKHSKWKNYKKRIFLNSKKLKSLSLLNPLIYRLKPRFIGNIKNYYSEGLLLKIFLRLFFDNSLQVKFFKNEFLNYNNKSLKNLLISLFLKPCFRVDILLWKLNFFKSPYAARQYINEKKILINLKSVKGNYFLKKGDIISFKSNNIDLFLIFSNLISNFDLYTFIEVDNYLKRIILIKDLKELSRDDLNLMVRIFFDTNKLKDYIMK